MTRAFSAVAAVAVLLSGLPPAGSTAAPAASSGWRAPLAGPVEVVRPFDPPPTPYAAGHRGADLAAHPDEAVLAAGRGMVSFAGRVAGRGVVVVAHADGLRTSYEPVRAAIAAGTVVDAGAVLGNLETSTHCPGPCLHWGLRDASGYRDPMELLDPPGADRVRLLPLDGPPDGSLSASRPTTSCAGRASPSSGSERPGSRRHRRARPPRRG